MITYIYLFYHYVLLELLYIFFIMFYYYFQLFSLKVVMKHSLQPILLPQSKVVILDKK